MFQADTKKNSRLNSRSGFEVVTFDCYGTLIDWETGIKRAFSQALEETGLSQSQGIELFELYQEEEKGIEARKPFRKYREVTSLAMLEAARKLGKEIPEKMSDTIAGRLPSWEPFPDTNPALEKLATKFDLGILSNVDNDLIAGTLKHLTTSFDFIVTAEKVRSYKPDRGHFDEAKRIIGPDRGWLHVAASVYHDVEPALRLGVNVIWVNRKNSAEGKRLKGRIVREVKDLTQLADWLAPVE